MSKTTADGASTELSLVWGARDIAAMIGVSQRKCFYLLESGKLPARKVGKRWVAERGALRDFFTPTVENCQ